MTHKKTIHPHDKFFKDAFSRISVVRSFVEQYLSHDDKSLIDILTLEAVKDSHVNPKLREIFSDAVYAGLTPDRSEHVYLIFEHKSYTDDRVGVQLHKNITIVLQYHQRQHGIRNVPIVFPILVCQKLSGLNTGNRPVYHFLPYEKQQSIFPDLRFTFVDLSLMPDEMIRGVAYLRILFLTLKYVHSSDLMEKIEDIIVIFKELNDDLDVSEYFEVLMNYLEGATSNSSFLKLQDQIKRILNEGEDEMSKMLEYVLQDIIKKKLEETATKSKTEGIKEGIEKEREIRTAEIALKMIANNMNDETIAKITGLTIEKIKELRKNKND